MGSSFSMAIEERSIGAISTVGVVLVVCRNFSIRLASSRRKDGRSPLPSTRSVNWMSLVTLFFLPWAARGGGVGECIDRVQNVLLASLAQFWPSPFALSCVGGLTTTPPCFSQCRPQRGRVQISRHRASRSGHRPCAPRGSSRWDNCRR